jgi:ABC-type sugar transport system permease subunit
MAVVIVFFVLPNLLTYFYSFTSWSTYTSKISWVGLGNFRALYSEGELVQPLEVTLIFAAIVTVIANFVALSLALLLEKATRFNAFMRGVFFLPVLISPLAAGYIWQGLVAPTGVLNAVLSFLSRTSHLGGPIAFQWLGSTTWTLYVVCFVQAWKWGGIFMLVYVAGLSAVPLQFVEAALVEGANWSQLLRHVKLPLLAPALTFGIVLSFVSSLSSIDTIVATTNGGPGDTTTVINMEVWSQVSQGLFGSATAVSLEVAVIAILSAVVLLGILRRREIQL